MVKAPVAVIASKENNISAEDNNISSTYLGLGLSATRYDSRCLSSISGCDGTENAIGLLIRAGYDYNEYIGAELRALVTLMNDDGGKIKHYGAFVKPMYPINDEFNLYGLVGYEMTTTSGTLRELDVSGLGFGVGFEYDLSTVEKGLELFVDYERLYYKKDGPDLDALNIGVVYNF